MSISGGSGVDSEREEGGSGVSSVERVSVCFLVSFLPCSGEGVDGYLLCGRSGPAST